MSVKRKVLVTIITPAYNRADLIGETIESVLRQDYPHIEYLVLDDGSVDDTLKIIKKYKNKLNWRTHSNMGEAKTVNLGFSMAKGEIVGVVNSDDPLLPGAISEIVEVMRKNPKVNVVYPDWKMIDDKGKLIKNVKVRDYNYLDMLRWHICTPGPGAFFRRELVEKLGGRDPQFRYVGDFDFWIRAGLIGPFIRIPKFLATFRVHPGSASIGKKGDLMASEHLKVIRNFYANKKLSKKLTEIKMDSLSSAYYYAGINCVANPIRRKYYFLMSLMCSPGNILTIQKRWRGYVLHELFDFIPFFKEITNLLGRYSVKLGYNP